MYNVQWIIINYTLLILNSFIGRHEHLDDAPADEVGHTADAEDNHISGRFAVETEEGEVATLAGSPFEKVTSTFVDGKWGQTASHRA